MWEFWKIIIFKIYLLTMDVLLVKCTHRVGIQKDKIALIEHFYLIEHCNLEFNNDDLSLI